MEYIAVYACCVDHNFCIYASRGSFEPVKVLSGTTVNGSAVDSATYVNYLAGTDAGFTASGSPSTGGDTIWATFVSE